MGKYIDMIRGAEKVPGQTGQDKEPVQEQRCTGEGLGPCSRQPNHLARGRRDAARTGYDRFSAHRP